MTSLITNDQPRRGRRAGKRKLLALDAAAKVIADRGADAARFVDVASASGVAVSTLQYYFGSREDMLVAAFRHASDSELTTLAGELASRDDPWEKVLFTIEDALSGYVPGDDKGPLWIEAWRFGLRDDEMRADVQRDYAIWQSLLAGAFAEGIARGRFVTNFDADQCAVLALALVDGIGLRVAVADPLVSIDEANEVVRSALATLLHVAEQ
jgi:AcrR family transcriptional regulator